MNKHIYCMTGITQKLHDFLTAFILAENNVTEYTVYLNSLGGVPWVGFSLYNFMKSRPEITTVYNMGNVDSAAVQFYLGFKNRHCVPTGTFMVHPATYPRDILPVQYSQFDAKRALHELDSIEIKTAQIIVNETCTRAKNPLTDQDVRNAIFQTRIIDAQTALDCGFTDSIVMPILPSSDVITVTDSFLSKF